MHRDKDVFLLQVVVLQKILSFPATIDVVKAGEESCMSECYECQHKRNVLGNCHIECVKPDILMEGSAHGIKEGWFMYPVLFDPTWKLKSCRNFEPTATVSHAVSDAVGDAVSPQDDQRK